MIDTVDLTNGFGLTEFNKLCLWAHEKKASDIFLTSDNQIKIKLNKALQNVSESIIDTTQIANVLRHIYMPSAPEELFSGRPISFDHSFLNPEDDSLVGFRVEATCCNDDMTDRGISLVLRTIPATPPSTEELGVEQQIINMMKADSGIIIISGATNSGKSTLAASLIRWYAVNFARVVLTYEAPIEFKLNGFAKQLALVIQSQVYKHIPNFAASIKNALRRSPDLIFVGEMRDEETIREGIKASKTGHLVLSTLHAESPEESVSRMVNEFHRTEAYSKTVDIIGALKGIITQKLVDKKGGGLIALKGVLDLNSEIRGRVEEGLRRDVDISSLLRLEVNTLGFSMLSNAKERYTQGLISLTTLVKQLDETGVTEDYLSLEDLANEALNNEKITLEEFNFDIQMIRGINERRYN